MESTCRKLQKNKRSDVNVLEDYLLGYLVDGVLNNKNTRTVTFDGWCFVDNFLIMRLKRIINATKAKIVLSSTWRDGWNREDESKNEPFFNQLRDKLKEYRMEIWDALPLPLQQNRGIAISNWFKSHKDLDIESFIILDDWYDMGVYRDHLVWINGNVGLTNENVEEAISFLNSKK